jgi:hypothetical protein
MAAKFRSLSPRKIEMWYDDGGAGTEQGHLKLGQETTTNTYAGHVFYFTVQGHKDQELARFTMNPDKVLYVIYDKHKPPPEKLLAATRKEQQFMLEYFNRTGIHWRHYYGPTGPRPPPVLYMWPAKEVGAVQVAHGVVHIFAQLVLVPALTTRFGLLRCFRAAMWPLIPLLLAFPLVARLAPAGPTVLFAAMCAAVAARALIFTLSFTSIMIIVNNLAPPASLGLVTGVAQAAASTIRTIGPALGGVLFSTALGATALGSWRLHVPYAAMAAIAAFTGALSFRLRRAECDAPPDDDAEAPF